MDEHKNTQRFREVLPPECNTLRPLCLYFSCLYASRVDLECLPCPFIVQGQGRIMSWYLLFVSLAAPSCGAYVKSHYTWRRVVRWTLRVFNVLTQKLCRATQQDGSPPFEEAAIGMGPQGRAGARLSMR
jgi:hypothetical protein